MEKFRYRKDEHKVLGAGEYSVEHDSARSIIWTGLYEGETIVALLVATNGDAHQNEIDRIGNKIVRACNSYEQLVEALKEARKELAWVQRHIGPGQLSASNMDTALAIDAALAEAGAA